MSKRRQRSIGGRTNEPDRKNYRNKEKKESDLVFSPRPRRSPEEVNQVIVVLESILDGLQAMGGRLDRIEERLKELNRKEGKKA